MSFYQILGYSVTRVRQLTRRENKLFVKNRLYPEFIEVNRLHEKLGLVSLKTYEHANHQDILIIRLSQLFYTRRVSEIKGRVVALRSRCPTICRCA